MSTGCPSSRGPSPSISPDRQVHAGVPLCPPESFPAIPTRNDAADDEFLFRQGRHGGLSKVRFDDWRAVYAKFADVPNVALFMEQAEALVTLLAEAAPDAAQQVDLDFGLAITELFTLVVYGQLILEQARSWDWTRGGSGTVGGCWIRSSMSWSATSVLQRWSCTENPAPVKISNGWHWHLSGAPRSWRSDSSTSGSK